MTELLREYERLGVLVEQRAYGVPLAETHDWSPGRDLPRIANTYTPERLGDGRVFSWTGPEACTTFALALTRAVDSVLTVEFMKVLDPAMFDRLTLAADGVPLKTIRQPHALEATLPARSPAIAAATLITIDTGFTARASSDDPRNLGIALFGLSVRPVACTAAES
jgi:hypothetical protein